MADSRKLQQIRRTAKDDPVHLRRAIVVLMPPRARRSCWVISDEVLILLLARLRAVVVESVAVVDGLLVITAGTRGGEARDVSQSG
ncbi:hypothetical protein ACFPH6_49490 [Streptomyces xiangluensis]|uniref:Uncharacterized protein n=1 Tax=Streptomyces xiangluensis TaxID=2665720 RepID=A0ABV8Z789_9ACTN